MLVGSFPLEIEFIRYPHTFSIPFVKEFSRICFASMLNETE